MSGKFVKIMTNYKGEEITCTGVIGSGDELTSILVNRKFNENEAQNIAKNYLEQEYSQDDGYDLKIGNRRLGYVELIPKEGCKHICKTELVWEFEVEE